MANISRLDASKPRGQDLGSQLDDYERETRGKMNEILEFINEYWQDDQQPINSFDDILGSTVADDDEFLLYDTSAHGNRNIITSELRKAIYGDSLKFVSQYVSLAAALSALGSAETTLIIDEPVNVSTDITIPATISLVLVNGGMLIRTGGTHLTINGSFECGEYQCFSDNTTGHDWVVGLKYAQSNWFGNDIKALCNSVANDGGKLVISTGNHAIAGTVTISGDNVELELPPNASISNTIYNQTALMVTGNNVQIYGGGTISSPSTWDGTNTQLTYGVIWVTGDGISIRDISITNVPKCGIGLNDINDALVTNCRITGNYPSESYTDVETGHVGIFYNPPGSGSGGNFVAANNIIKTCVQGIDVGNYGAALTNQGVIIDSNIFEECWNHGVYDNCALGIVINGNNFVRCSRPVVTGGRRSVVTNNTMTSSDDLGYLTYQAIAVRDAVGCIVSGNTIYGAGQNGSGVIALESLTNTIISDNVIANNTIDLTANDGDTTCFGIRVGGSLAINNDRNIIRGNVLNGYWTTTLGAIVIQTASGSYGYFNSVCDNTVNMKNCSPSIYAVYQKHLTIHNNIINSMGDLSSPGSLSLLFVAEAQNVGICNNRFSYISGGANVNARGINALTNVLNLDCKHNVFDFSSASLTGKTQLYFNPSDYVRAFGNILENDYPISGSVTIGTGNSSATVSNKNIDQHSKVLVSPKNTYAATVVMSSGYYVTTVAGTSFTITLGTGTAAGNAVFDYVIV